MKETNDQLEYIFDSMVDENSSESTNMSDAQPGTSHSLCFENDGELVSNELMIDHKAVIDLSTGPGDFPSSATVPLIGDHIKDFRTPDDRYYRGVVSATTSAGEDVLYSDDGYVETIISTNETWRLPDGLMPNATGFPGQ